MAQVYFNACKSCKMRNSKHTYNIICFRVSGSERVDFCGQDAGKPRPRAYTHTPTHIYIHTHMYTPYKETNLTFLNEKWQVGGISKHLRDCPVLLLNKHESSPS